MKTIDITQVELCSLSNIIDMDLKHHIVCPGITNLIVISLSFPGLHANQGLLLSSPE